MREQLIKQLIAENKQLNENFNFRNNIPVMLQWMRNQNTISRLREELKNEQANTQLY